MTSTSQHRAPTRTPELSMSDSDESHSSSEDEMMNREQVDRLLRQAHHYVITEGGDDSPHVYMERIQRIDQDMLQEIAEQGYDCDAKLYRRVRQKVDHVQREFEDTVDAPFIVEPYDELPEHYSAAAKEALCRGESEDESHTLQRIAKKETERNYLYGGSGNEPEFWHKKYPASLPFPETIRMADWESLRIHYDLATTSIHNKKEPTRSQEMSYHNLFMTPPDSLTRYESGSRFKLPAVDPEGAAKVSELGTVEKLRKLVQVYNNGDNSKNENGEYKYAPRVFLERLSISPSTVIDDVRTAVNASPTRSRSSSNSSRKGGSTPPATLTLLDEQQKTWTSHENKDNNLTPAPHKEHAVSPAIRRIKAATEASIRSSLHETPQRHLRSTPSPTGNTPTSQPTASGIKRKRLSTDACYALSKDEGASSSTPVKPVRKYRRCGGGVRILDPDSKEEVLQEESVEVVKPRPRGLAREVEALKCGNNRGGVRKST